MTAAHITSDTATDSYTTLLDSTLVTGDQFAGLSKADVGLGLGWYAPEVAAFLRFSLQPTEAKDWACGDNHVTVKVAADTPAGSKSTEVVLNIIRRCS